MVLQVLNLKKKLKTNIPFESGDLLLQKNYYVMLNRLELLILIK